MTITTVIALSGAGVGALTGIGALINSFYSAKTASATATKLIEEVYGDIIEKLRERIEDLEKTIKGLTDHSCNNYDCEFRNKKMP
jgi:hypothetical protein